MSMTVAWDAVGAISGAVATCIVLAGGLYAHLQWREAKLSRNIALLLQIRDRYHSPSMRELRRRLLSGDLGAPEDFDAEALSSQDFNDFWDLLDQLEMVGFLVERGILDVSLATAVFHRSPPCVWEVVQPYILRRRSEVPRESRYLERLVQHYRS
jgi:hypothetical protein